MSVLTQMTIAYEMFKDYLASVFGSGLNFPSPLCPQPAQEYVK